MSAFLMPSIYKGDSVGIAVMFAGLNNEIYTSLELSIDEENFIQIERDSIPFYSAPYTFDNLEENKIYCVKGRIIHNNITTFVECNFIANKKIEVFNNEYFTHQSGGMSVLPQSPTSEVI